ncbi:MULTISPECIES: ion transporter [unclassified Saccharopolyspora]|uniref:ion transporter n=1 Tax=unclassified Saccharopolyspora TaxID=2646250 RepID=UPI002107C3B4|nr:MULTISPECIES: ion transporter [unclassified Saccharopolyspora]
MSERVRVVVDAPAFQKAITAVILINAITLGCETFPGLSAQYGDALRAVDQTALAVFVVELAARLFAYRAAFFRDPWNCFATRSSGWR